MVSGVYNSMHLRVFNHKNTDYLTGITKNGWEMNVPGSDLDFIRCRDEQQEQQRNGHELIYGLSISPYFHRTFRINY